MAEPVTIKIEGDKDLVRYLQLLGKVGPAAVANGLNDIASDWQREIIKRAPVDTGLYRQSINTIRATAANVEAAVGTNVPYAIELEYNPRGHIASGAVKAWTPGTPVVVDWPAKTARGGSSRGKKGQFKKGSGGGGREQIMPPFRGTWQIIQKQLLLKMRSRVESRLNRIKKPQAK